MQSTSVLWPRFKEVDWAEPVLKLMHIQTLDACLDPSRRFGRLLGDRTKLGKKPA